VQTTETELTTDIWSNSLTGTSEIQSDGSLDSLSQPNVGCLSLQSAESAPLSLAKCMSVACQALSYSFMYCIGNIVSVLKAASPL